MITKTCNKCNIEKDINEFSFRKDSQNFRNTCKICINSRGKQIKKQKFENYEWQIELKELECRTCKIVKTIDCFPRRKDTEFGLRTNCKDCKNRYNKE